MERVPTTPELLSLSVGYFTALYRSSIDDSQQPFALWVPRSYSPEKEYPLVVALHGMDDDHRMIPEKCFQIHEQGFREDVILLSPFGRGDMGFRWMGEADVWESISWVKERYSIDPQRQYLTGLSMGGFACWRLALDYPEQWAAIAPVCGGSDVKNLEAWSAVPVWCVHGANDQIVSIDNSREMVAELRRLNLNYRYDELWGWGHNAWDWLYDPKRKQDTLVDWFLNFRQPAPPAPILEPRRQGNFGDLFGQRIIISYPTQSLLGNEGDLLRAQADKLARFTLGDLAMRTGQLLVKPDYELTNEDFEGANHLMLGRSENHVKMNGKLAARHVHGCLEVAGQKWLGKSLVAATCQRSPWNKKRLLGIVTYQQRGQVTGLARWILEHLEEMQAVNVYDTDRQCFLKQGRLSRF